MKYFKLESDERRNGLLKFTRKILLLTVRFLLNEYKKMFNNQKNTMYI